MEDFFTKNIKPRFCCFCGGLMGCSDLHHPGDPLFSHIKCLKKSVDEAHNEQRQVSSQNGQ